MLYCSRIQRINVAAAQKKWFRYVSMRPTTELKTATRWMQSKCKMYTGFDTHIHQNQCQRAAEVEKAILLQEYGISYCSFHQHKRHNCKQSLRSPMPPEKIMGSQVRYFFSMHVRMANFFPWKIHLFIPYIIWTIAFYEDFKKKNIPTWCKRACVATIGYGVVFPNCVALQRNI